MDPTANLTEQRKLTQRILRCKRVSHVRAQCFICVGHAERLAELVEALDGWITRGGFLPTQWQVKP
jgi:hypothetical protein